MKLRSWYQTSFLLLVHSSYLCRFSSFGGYNPGKATPRLTCSMIHVSSCSCSIAALTTSSLGNTATPPQPIGSCQPTNVSAATEGGAEAPWHQTGKPTESTPAISRTAPSVTRA